MKKEIVYISGKVTGLDLVKVKAQFEKAERYFEELGYQVVNPMKDIIDESHPWEYYMRNDIKALMDCTKIAMLPGWGDSKGARLEKYLADQLGFSVEFLPENFGYEK